MKMQPNGIPDYGTLRQERIEQLLQGGIKFPLLVVEAPPGYGKSRAVETFLSKQPSRHVWFRLCQMDNETFFFWNHFTSALASLYPSIKDSITKTGFPDIKADVKVFLNSYYEQTIEEERTILVIDDYSVLENRQIILFVETLVELGLDNTCIILISSKPTSFKTISLHSSFDAFFISQKDLMLRLDDVENLFAQHGTPISNTHAQLLIDKWDGWPLAIWHLAVDDKAQPEDYDYPVPTIQQLFYDGYYAKYSEDLQQLLVQFSLVDACDTEMLEALGGDLGKFRGALPYNPFIVHDPQEGMLYLRHPYKCFLAERQSTLSLEKQAAAYVAAADMMIRRHKLEDALPLLLQSKRYDQMVDIIWQLLDVYMGHATVKFIVRHLAQLPEEYVHKNPRVDLQRAILTLLLQGPTEAREHLYKLLDRYDADDLPDIAVLGETHFLMAYISIISMREDFVEHLRYASQYLPEGSRYLSDYSADLMNMDLVKLPDNQPGTLDRVTKLYENAFPYAKTLHSGWDVGQDRLFSCQAAFYTYNLEEAGIYAQEIAYAAQQDQHQEMLLLSHYYLARIAMLQGRVTDVEQLVDLTEAYLSQPNNARFRGFQERMAYLLYLYTGKTDAAPRWMADRNLQELPLWEAGRYGIIQAFYLVATNQHLDAIALLNRMEAINAKAYSWVNLIYLKVCRAMAHSRVDNTPSAMQDLVSAYEMTYANGIITPFIECGTGMRTLLDMARKEIPDVFDKEWRDSVYNKASSYAKTLYVLRKHNETDPLVAEHITPRRLSILRGLAHGFNMEEIGRQNHISVNTVKTHVHAIYSQLGAVNRADAIRIATLKKLI